MFKTKSSIIHLILFVLFFGVFLFFRYGTDCPPRFASYCFYPIGLCTLLCAITKYSLKQKCLMVLTVALADLFLYNIMETLHFPYYIPFASAAAALLVSYLVDRKWGAQAN